MSLILGDAALPPLEASCDFLSEHLLWVLGIVTLVAGAAAVLIILLRKKRGQTK